MPDIRPQGERELRPLPSTRTSAFIIGSAVVIVIIMEVIARTIQPLYEDDDDGTWSAVPVASPASYTVRLYVGIGQETRGMSGMPLKERADVRDVQGNVMYDP